MNTTGVGVLGKDDSGIGRNPDQVRSKQRGRQVPSNSFSSGRPEAPQPEQGEKQKRQRLFGLRRLASGSKNSERTQGTGFSNSDSAATATHHRVWLIPRVVAHPQSRGSSPGVVAHPQGRGSSPGSWFIPELDPPKSLGTITYGATAYALWAWRPGGNWNEHLSQVTGPPLCSIITSCGRFLYE